MISEKTLGSRIKDCRQDKDMTQSMLAKKLNRPRETIARWENCTRYPSIDEIATLADIFCTSTDFLIRGVSFENQTVSSDLGLSDIAINTLKFYKSQNERVPLDFYSRVIEDWYSFYSLACLIDQAKKLKDDMTKYTIEQLLKSDNVISVAIANTLEADQLRLSRLDAYEYLRRIVDYLIDGGARPHVKA